MFRVITLALAAGSLLAAAPVAAQAFVGTVTRVKDGDSLLIRRTGGVGDGRIAEVRMAAIDAPELHQPWGPQAKAALRRLVEGRPVAARVTDRDRYGRLVAFVTRGPLNVNLAMVAGGDAWAYSRYERDPAILAAAALAKARGLGLWALPPNLRVPPPVWRETHPRRPG